MQRPAAANVHLPYSKWSQHRADNGLIYLSHPVTGEVKWLWSRHHDPKTSNDYLVNTVTSERQWVTKENEHLCPVSIHNSTNQQQTTNSTPASNGSTNPFTEKRSQRKKPVTAPKRQPTTENPKYREIAAPKSLGLTADEVLMLVPETGRRYIFNKKTNSSRWLPDRPPDTIPATSTQRTFLGRSKPKSATDIDNDIHPDLREKTKTPFFDPNEPPATHHSSSSPSTPHKVPNSHTAENNSTNPPSQQPTKSSRPTQQAQGNRADRASSRQSADITSSNQSHAPTSPKAAAAKRNSFNRPRRELNPVTEKLDALGSILHNIKNITATGKYDMNQLRQLVTVQGNEEQVSDGSQRLLELEEYLTQQMLRVDAVESQGNQLVRAKRKETVNTILSLTDEIELLRTKLKNL
ncbi:BAG domain containing protein [Gracilaria domingensis]|nr:BAG domain containing protein [Gracilaria domingensis]